MGRGELQNWISSSFVAQVLNLNVSSHLYPLTQPPVFLSIATDCQSTLDIQCIFSVSKPNKLLALYLLRSEN